VAEPADPDGQLEELCRVLNYFGVAYIVFGSHVARLNGVPLETIDVDVVPARLADNLNRLAEALNLLRPRWRVEGIPEGMKIDGGLEARHFLGDSAAVGLVTRLGPVDVVLEPRGFEGLHRPHREVDEGAPGQRRDRGLVDLIRSKELLHRAKDVEHLAVLYEQFPELAPGARPGPEPQ
jgi:hypothetical protein